MYFISSGNCFPRVYNQVEDTRHLFFIFHNFIQQVAILSTSFKLSIKIQYYFPSITCISVVWNIRNNYLQNNQKQIIQKNPLLTNFIPNHKSIEIQYFKYNGYDLYYNEKTQKVGYWSNYYWHNYWTNQISMIADARSCYKDRILLHGDPHLPTIHVAPDIDCII